MRMSLLMILALCLLWPAAAIAEVKHETFTAKDLTIANLIGKITIEAAGGSDFEVDIDVQGRDAAKEPLKIERTEGSEARLTIRFPVAKEKRFVYPAMGSTSSTQFSVGHDNGDGDWLSWILPGLTGNVVRVSGKGKGTEVWADVTVRVPAGASLDVKHGVGRIESHSTRAALTLDTHNGPVEVTGNDGDVSIDTGSGTVLVSDVHGELTVDTGSGSVRVAGCDGKGIAVDTGSGDVTAETLRCRSLKIDTGSGAVDARGVDAGDALIDTGSGSVILEIATLGDGRFAIDTGSGGVELIVPADASAVINAETGIGKIDVDLAGVKIDHRENDSVRLTVGSGKARIDVDTGAGRIRIHS